jgi:hypothetical protein
MHCSTVWANLKYLWNSFRRRIQINHYWWKLSLLKCSWNQSRTFQSQRQSNQRFPIYAGDRANCLNLHKPYRDKGIQSSNSKATGRFEILEVKPKGIRQNLHELFQQQCVRDIHGVCVSHAHEFCVHVEVWWIRNASKLFEKQREAFGFENSWEPILIHGVTF